MQIEPAANEQFADATDGPLRRISRAGYGIFVTRDGLNMVAENRNTFDKIRRQGDNSSDYACRLAEANGLDTTNDRSSHILCNEIC